MPQEEEMFAWKLDREGVDTRKEREFQTEGKAGTTNTEKREFGWAGSLGCAQGKEAGKGCQAHLLQGPLCSGEFGLHPLG